MLDDCSTKKKKWNQNKRSIEVKRAAESAEVSKRKIYRVDRDSGQEPMKSNEKKKKKF